MAYYLGVDGGQSSTTALIADDTGRVVGSGRGGPCNHVKTGDGREKFINALSECVAAACREAALPDDLRFAVASLGFSGGPADKHELVQQTLFADRYLVTNDAMIALTGATNGEPGVVVIAGTGSIALGRNGAGKTARAGGWGYLFGDEGGAFDITRQALRAILRFEEGWGPRTTLREKLLAATGATNANELMHRFYTTDYPRPRIAGFSKLVDEAASEGDSIARALLQDAGQHLASLATVIRAQLFQGGDPARISYIGGVWRSALLLERFRSILELDESNVVAAPVHGPAAGALLDAFRAAAIKVELTNLPEFEKS